MGLKVDIELGWPERSAESSRIALIDLIGISSVPAMKTSIITVQAPLASVFTMTPEYEMAP
jgi:hypothetical protein